MNPNQWECICDRNVSDWLGWEIRLGLIRFGLILIESDLKHSLDLFRLALRIEADYVGLILIQRNTKRFMNFKLISWVWNFCPLARISIWTSFLTNPKFSDTFRNLHQNQKVSFWYKSKNVLNPIWLKTVKNQSDIFRFNPTYSNSIRDANLNKSKVSFESESIRINPNFD